MKRKTVGISLMFVIVIGIAIGAYVVANSKPASTGVWKISAEISNKGVQDTTEFNISNPWRILWKMDTNPSNLFIVAVALRNGTGYSDVAEAYAADTNSTTGILPVLYIVSFIIRVIAPEDTEWTLQIQEFTIANQTQ